MNLPEIRTLLFILLPVSQIACAEASLLGAQRDAFEEDQGKENETGEDGESNYPDAPAGTCTAWKYAYCDAIIACSAFIDKDQCELDVGWLVCRDDAPLEKCETAIRTALGEDDCDELPVECGPSAIADRAPVVELCEEIHNEMCEHRFFCGLEFSTESCMDTLSQTEPCTGFTSFLPTAVDCVEAYSTLGCEEGMPKVCAGALRR